ncbi:hypothetical protein [Moheibacter sp.]|uniref:hypothetical protein n=1 Tax=Moheibacter sp. TaxID=1965316 RepID=UPI003C7771D5
MKFSTFILLFSFLFINISCFEDLFGLEDDGDEYYYGDDDGGGSGNLNPGYDYYYECPGGYGSSFTVPIPEGTASCQQAYEYFARVYGCNDIDNFNSANCALCHDCGIENYCTVCE